MDSLSIVDSNPEANECALDLLRELTIILKSDSADAREVAGFVALATVRELVRIKNRGKPACKMAA